LLLTLIGGAGGARQGRRVGVGVFVRQLLAGLLASDRTAAAGTCEGNHQSDEEHETKEAHASFDCNRRAVRKTDGARSRGRRISKN
jgi:hypothetical protein